MQWKPEQRMNDVWNIFFPLQGPAARYLQNIELKQEVDKTARTVEKQERQIEALESQVAVINPSRLAKSKVGSINTTESYWIYLSSRLLAVSFWKLRVLCTS